MILEYFNIENGDAALVTWSHAVNSKEKLKNVINDPLVMFIESDILISDKNEVIMSHPPILTSDLTFNEWFDICKTSNKGLKLDFKTQNVIDICLKKLNNENIYEKLPVILNADILQANLHTPKPLINADYFLNLCKSHKNSLLSIGWTTINSTVFNYTWSNVFEMFNLINKYSLKQVTLPVRANWALKSIYRLNWLCKHTNSTLTIWSHDTDHLTSIESLLLFRKYFSNSNVYYDLPLNMRDYLDNNFDHYNERLSNSNDDLVKYYLKLNSFDFNLWSDSKQVFLNEYGGLMTGYGSYLKTRKQYKADANEAIIYEIFGKFEIFKTNNNDNQKHFLKKQQELLIDKNIIEQTNLIDSNNDCIKISIRTSEHINNYETIGNFENKPSDGSVVIYMFLNGAVKIIADNKVSQEGNLYSNSNLLEFLITDVGDTKDIHIDLTNYDSNMNKYSLQFLIKSNYINNQKFFINIQLLSSIYSVGIDSLKLSDEISDPQDYHANY